MYLPTPYFANVPHIGDLNVEKVIVDYDELIPIYFTLRDNKNNLYLCSCYDTKNGQQWILASTSPEDIIDVLSDRMTLATPFKYADEAVLIDWNHDTKEETFKVIDREQIQSDVLPVEGEYLEDGADFWVDYIRNLKKEAASSLRISEWKKPLFEKVERYTVQLHKSKTSFLVDELPTAFGNIGPQIILDRSIAYRAQVVGQRKFFA